MYAPAAVLITIAPPTAIPKITAGAPAAEIDPIAKPLAVTVTSVITITEK